MIDPDLLARTKAWMQGDPNPETRAELQRLIDTDQNAELSACMGAELDFGTAGLRGPVGPGPSRMNRAVVERATRAFAEHLLAQDPDCRSLPVVVGYDARPSSRALAEAAVSVLLAAGISVRFFEEPQATPIVAYTARVLASAGALVITASHNPREDNGLKVYGRSASQLVAPLDADIRRRRELQDPAVCVPSVPFPEVRVGALGASAERAPPHLLDRYLAELGSCLPVPSGSRALRIAYTPLHGLGLLPVQRALKARGFRDLNVVAEQASPDGRFPTTPFPNPELPETLERVLALAEVVQAELVLANDPDVDRLAAAAPLPSGRFHVFTGNELGALLADFVLENAQTGTTPLFVTSVVSSPLLARIGEHHGARTEITLTGFKWIWAAALALESAGAGRFAFGCEEALGYSIGHLVRDKDGIAAAVWLAELAARCRNEKKSLLDRLHDLYERHGAWGSAQRSLSFEGPLGQAALRSSVERLLQSPPKMLGGEPFRGVLDYRTGGSERPAWRGTAELFELRYGDCARVLIRPSGTEHKLKLYADQEMPFRGLMRPEEAARRAREGAQRLADELAALLG